MNSLTIINKMKRFYLMIAASLLALSAFAQGQQMPQLPNDPAVRIGKLDNGMTYYIRHNAKPEKRAEIYLATNAGAINQTPDQQGLAHFLEHMCFNGTKNFPEKGILNWLQSIGASFGGNVNASTGVEETQYMLNNIPLVRPTVIDTCLLIMHDYSHFVANDPKEIDAERGVIIEERRSRRNASWRMLEKAGPYYYGEGTKYATSMTDLIGSQEQLETFKPASLETFYKTWYIPDNQAIIVVGDIDVDEIEGKIKKIFSDIPKVKEPAQKEVFTFQPFKERVGVITDPEASSPSIIAMWQSEAMPEEYNSTALGYMNDLIENIITLVMGERFEDITSNANSPYLSAGFGVGELNEFTDAAFGQVSLKEDNILGGFKDFLVQLEKMKRYGFTEAEVSRAKENILSSLEKSMNEAESRMNSEFVHPMISNFFDNEPILDPATEYQLAQSVLGQVNAQVLNQVVPALITDENLVIVYEGPEKEGIKTPTVDELKAALESAKTAEIEAPVEEVVEQDLLDPAALKGSKVKKTSTTIYGATEWKLKNGITVIALPTDYKKDQILFRINEFGGTSLISDEDIASFDSNIYSLFNSMSGVSKFKSNELSKVLTGKHVSATPYINGLRHGVSGSSSVKDLETALQLAYLYYTDPRFDQEEYDNAMAQLKAALSTIEAQPTFGLQKRLYEDLYANKARNEIISDAKVEKASLQTIEKNYRKLFSDAAGAQMIIVGDIDLETLKPLVEKYIGSIPGGKKASKFIDVHDDYNKGEIIDVFNQDMETPLTTVVDIYTNYAPYSVKDEVLLNAVSYIMDQVYTETLREEEGGTYGASTAGSASIEPTPLYLFQIQYQCKPAMADKLREIAAAEFKKLGEEGPTDVQMTRTAENFKKNIPESRISNSYWLGNISNYLRYGNDYDKEYEAAVNSLTKEDIKEAARKMVESGNLIEIVMKPGKTTETE